MSDSFRDESGFSKALKMAEKIYPLGHEKTSFSMWKEDILDIIEDYELKEKEKKRIVLASISDKYKDKCHHIYHSDRTLKNEDFIEKIKTSLGFDNISTLSLKKLQNIKIGNKSIIDYNMKFSLLLKDVEDDERPVEKCIIRMYIEGLKGKKIQEYLIVKDPKTLEEAMKFAQKLQKGFSEYEEDSSYRLTNNSSLRKSHNNVFKNNNNYNHNYNNKKSTFSHNSNFYNNTKGQNTQTKSSNKDTDIEKLTDDFAKMRLTVCYRCNQKGHIARFCTNDLSSENRAILNQHNNNEHLN